MIGRAPRTGPAAPAMTPRVAAALRSPAEGDAVPASVRAVLEPGLGADLSGVRVHQDPRARDAAARLGARALTFGGSVFLGPGESAHDVPLMAHEAVHVLQQRTALGGAGGEGPAQLLPSFITDRLASYARHVPGYTLLTVVIGADPLTGEPVARTAQNLVGGILGLVPFGTAVFDTLVELGVVDAALAFVDRRLATWDLSLGRLERVISDAWDEMDFVRTDPFDFNLPILVRRVSALVDDVGGFAGSVLDALLELVRQAVRDVAEPLLAENRAWGLATKILRHDPLRDQPVEATTVEILEDFLVLIGRETELEQMRARGTLQETAAWLDTQLTVVQTLVGELGALLQAAWEAIRPENLPDLMANLRALVARVSGLLQRAWDFAVTVAAKVVEFVKKALLGWLSTFLRDVPGFPLLTVLLGRDPFTGEAVPRGAAGLIRGFLTLLPNGAATYERLAESGVVDQAAATIETAVAELGISWAMVTGLFRGVWDGLSIADLVDPIGAFQRVRDQFGEPIGRLFAFVRVVLREVLTLVLALMQFPTGVLDRILANALAAYDDVRRDPVAFLINMLGAVKEGFARFFAGIFDHLLGGLTDWLFRGLRSAGIDPPAELTLQSGLGLLLQLLGITAERLWEKLAERIGPERVAQIRGAVDRLTGIWTFVRDVQENGVSAVWTHVQGQLSGLWDTIIGHVRTWVMEQIVNRVTVKLLSMLDPTGVMAVVNSFVALFNAVQSAVEYVRELLDIVDRFVGTVAAVARGDIQPGAAMVEQGLIAAVPVAIGFLANQVGLGNIGDKITEIVGGLRTLVDQALDWLLDQAERLLQSALNALGIGGRAAQAAGPGPATPPETVEPLPPGLPPDEIKRRVLDMVTARLGRGDMASIQTVHSFLQTVVTSNRDSGLRDLRVRVADPGSMAVEVIAEASAPQTRRLAWEEIFAASALDADEELAVFRSKLDLAGEDSYAALAVDGSRVGELSSSRRGLHAEEGLVRSSAWTDALDTAKQSVAANGSSTLTLMINRSPCAACTEWLVSAIKEARSRLGDGVHSRVLWRLAATGTYRRQARIKPADMAILREGAQKIATRLGRPFDEVFEEQAEIWREDLRSSSTEWSDADEEYSGLASLASAGWQVFGLDTGGPLLPRRLEMGQIAARLAEKFGWGT
ncbi:DUF4157 domain-containing protein [Geodermatophilus sp. SYSU D01062]